MFFRVLAITLHCDTVAVEGIGPSSRSPNECNPLGAFVTWCPRIPHDILRHAYRQNCLSHIPLEPNYNGCFKVANSMSDKRSAYS
jgi:hypothetical protein